MSLSSTLKLAASQRIHNQSALKNINQQRRDSEMTNMLHHSPRETGGGDGEKKKSQFQPKDIETTMSNVKKHAKVIAIIVILPIIST